MEFTKEEKSIIKNLKAESGKLFIAYILLGLGGLSLILYLYPVSKLSTLLIFLSGTLFGIGSEKYTSGKLRELLRKFYKEFFNNSPVE